MEREFEIEMQLLEERLRQAFNGELTVDFQDVTKIPRPNFAEFFLNPILSDITFLIGKDEVQVPGHKIIIASQSEVFLSLFMTLVPDHLAFRDIESESFSSFLEFFYTHDTKLNPETMFDVLKLAARFDVELLEEKCISFICENITTETAFEYLDKAIKVEHPVMVETLFRFLGRNIEKIIEKDEFKSASYDALLAFFEQPIAKCKEADLAEMAIKWAREGCQKNSKEPTPENLRTHLGEIFGNIRFPLMTLPELDDFIGAHQVLTTDEIRKFRGIYYGKYFDELDKKLTRYRNLDFVDFTTEHVVSFVGENAMCQPTSPNNFERTVEFPEDVLVCGIGLRMKKALDLVEGAYLTINDYSIDLGENFSRCIKESVSDDEYLIRIKFPLAKFVQAKTLYTFVFYNPYGFGIGRNNLLYAIGSGGEEFYHSERSIAHIHINALKYLYLKDDQGVVTSKLFSDYDIDTFKK